MQIARIIAREAQEEEYFLTLNICSKNGGQSKGLQRLRGFWRAGI